MEVARLPTKYPIPFRLLTIALWTSKDLQVIAYNTSKSEGRRHFLRILSTSTPALDEPTLERSTLYFLGSRRLFNRLTADRICLAYSIGAALVPILYSVVCYFSNLLKNLLIHSRKHLCT